VAMSAGYIPFHPNPSKPKYKPPAGARRCPLPCVRAGESVSVRAGAQVYAGCDAPKEKLFGLRDFLVSTKMSSCRRPAIPRTTGRWSMRLETSAARPRVLLSWARRVTDAELNSMDRAGVKGVRFNFVKRLVDFTPRDVLERIAARVAPARLAHRGLFEMPDLPEFEDFSSRCPRRLWSTT